MRAEFAWVGMLSAVFMLAVSNGSLIVAQRRLVETVRDYREMVELSPGESVGVLTGTTASGRTLSIEYGDPAGRVTLLLVYTTQCPYSQENWATWTKLLSEVDRDTVRVVGVDLTKGSDAQFLAGRGLTTDEVLVTMDHWTATSYKFRRVPTTIVLDRSGRVEQVWEGKLSDAASVALRGLLPYSGGMAVPVTGAR